MSKAGLDTLRARVHDDPGLARRLHAADPQRFRAELARVVAELDVDVDESDIDAAAAEGSQAWVLRWIR